MQPSKTCCTFSIICTGFHRGLPKMINFFKEDENENLFKQSLKQPKS